MKKVLALVLATVMALGMTTVALAADTYYEVNVNTNGYLMNSDDKVDATLTLGGTAIPGKTIYYPVTAYKDSQVNPTTVTTKVSDLNNYKISYTIDDGKNMIESVKFVNVKQTGFGAGSPAKGLFVAVKLKDNFITDDVDVNMTIKITSKNQKATFTNPTGTVNNYELQEFVETFTAQYITIEDVANGYISIDKAGNALTFDAEADDVTMMFDKDIEVQGNMVGQKKVVVRLDTSNAAIEDKYPDATIRFFAGDKDTFRRDVTVTMPYDASSENPYLYTVDAKGTLTKIVGGSNADKAANETGAKYDDAIGAFVFKTKTLGNYVISDTELKSTSVDAPVDTPVEGEQPSEGNEPNPGTGANDFVGLAVAMAVVSLAGIAVAKRK